MRHILFIFDPGLSHETKISHENIFFVPAPGVGMLAKYLLTIRIITSVIQSHLRKNKTNIATSKYS